ncbi:hypothetical protein Nepgr_020497 [Nepenthes gracilis]|uniref:VQ domain-containing protein n=1 Tax=Nepenthes gracilis TaxID=150966 RepID=A0AAD3SXE4_NEPGR|nr:hypothetical protein Nepgr_020497 [Nepenthes gracilis]
MASYDNLASIESWQFPDVWISEAFVGESETLTKALKNNRRLSEIVTAVKPEATFSGGLGSDPESVSRPNTRRMEPAPGGKLKKRKSRSSKQSPTMFIPADRANFRQLVQQMTGIQSVNGQAPVPPVLRPEPKRPACGFVNWLQGCLPTLDTPSFLLDLSQQQVTANAAPVRPQDTMAFSTPTTNVDGPGFNFDSSASFPTLESWKFM